MFDPPVHPDDDDDDPNLDRIPQDRWREVLAPLSRATRQFARSGTQSDVITARVLTVRGVERALYEHRRDP
jgi:hypothetical protein